MKTAYLRQKRDALENMYTAHSRALVKLAEKNEKVVSLYGDFPAAEVGEVFPEKYPDRMIDVGIAEGHLITSAAGLADAGWIPFTHCHDIFALGRGYNQIRQNLAYDNRNAKVVLCNSGVVWPAIGPSHQTIEDIAALRAIPNLVILSPSDAITSEKATFAAADYVGPVILRLPYTGAAYPTLYTEDFEFEIGKAVCIHEGSDVTILATGVLVNDTLQAAEELEAEGIHVRVLDIQTIKPLDVEAILSAAEETGAIVTVEDGNIYGGLGGAVAELTSEKYPVLVKRVGVRDQFGDSGTIEEIKECFGLTPPMIKQAVYEVMERKGMKKKRKGRK